MQTQDPESRSKSCVLGAAGSIMTISLSINRCSHSKRAVWTDKRIQYKYWLVQKFGLWRLYRFDTIQAKPSFLLLNQEDKRMLCLLGVIHSTNATFFRNIGTRLYGMIQSNWRYHSSWTILRWCHTRPFTMKILRATQCCNIVATLFWIGTTLFQHCNIAIH